jgi:hypothetical protein
VQTAASPSMCGSCRNPPGGQRRSRALPPHPRDLTPWGRQQGGKSGTTPEAAAAKFAATRETLDADYRDSLSIFRIIIRDETLIPIIQAAPWGAACCRMATDAALELRLRIALSSAPASGLYHNFQRRTPLPAGGPNALNLGGAGAEPLRLMAQTSGLDDLASNDTLTMGKWRGMLQS